MAGCHDLRRKINFKTPYVDIKLGMICLNWLHHLYFKTPYVDIKHFKWISLDNLELNFKTPYVDIKQDYLHDY